MKEIFLCNKCGFTSVFGDATHKCDIRKPKRSFYSNRKTICRSCVYLSGRSCTYLNSPDRKQDTKFSSKQPEAYCEKSFWGKVIDLCPSCNHTTINLEGVEKCEKCDHQFFETKETIKRSRTFDGNLTEKEINFEKTINNRIISPTPNSPFKGSGDFKWISTQKLVSDTIKLIPMIPKDIDCIIGVARGGLTPASILAAYLNLPMFIFRQSIDDIVPAGHGWRLPVSQANSEFKHALLIDDNAQTGNSNKAARASKELKEKFPKTTYATVYVNKNSRHYPDIWVERVTWPVILEWNVFNSIHTGRLAVDFDGILCEDCERGQDDDGPKYLDFIENAKPKYLPRRVPISLIVTARIEKYREPTMKWLEKHGIKVNKLVMHPAKTLKERRKDDIAAYKARHFSDFCKNNKPYPSINMFFESCPRQAQKIHQLTNEVVICPATESVFVANNNNIKSRVTGQRIRTIDPKTDFADDIKNSTKRKAIVTVLGGDAHKQIFDLTGPRIEEYAKKCDADLIVLEEDKFKEWPMGNKFRISPVLQQYERTLYLDVDVIIKQDAEDIFKDEKIPSDKFAAFNEIHESVRKNQIKKFSDEYYTFCRSQPILQDTEFDKFFNGGVMLIPKEMASVYKCPDDPFPAYWYVDQFLIKYNLDKVKEEAFELDRIWNHCYMSKHFWSVAKLAKANFIHLNGCNPHGYRLKLTKKILGGDYSAENLPKGRKGNLPLWAHG